MVPGAITQDIRRPVVGVLLAAGSGLRFGGDKLMATLGDGRAIASAALTNLAAGVDAVVAVVRVGDDALADMLARGGARVRECPNAADGMGASLACGIRAAIDEYPDAIGWVLALADMPWLAPATVRSIADALRQGAPLAAPEVDNRRGHPVAFAARFGDELAKLSGDEGARRLLAAHDSSVVRVVTSDRGVFRDVDTRADLDSPAIR